MASLPPRTPVIVGVGFHVERDDDPTRCVEPYQLMVRAVRAAAADAGNAALPAQLESIAVTQGMWQYRNPGRLVAAELGCPTAKSIVSDLGVLQLTPFDDLCRAIAGGELELGVVAGGEAQYRALRGMITGQPAHETEQPADTPPPDLFLKSSDMFCSDLEGQRGLNLPVELFAIIESALRHAQGLDVETHRDCIAELYSSFSAIAADNPHAWRRDVVAPAEIRDPIGKNAMLAFPYTKRHCTQWNVNRGVAILVASAAKAEALGLDPAGWIFPVAAAESRHVVVLAQQRRLHSHPGTILCGERALALAGIGTADLTAAELYSCFPAAIQSFARDLRLEGVCPLTVTGAMPFAGGPYNHFSLEGVARMAEVLREGGPGRRFGLVANLSGIFGKQGCAVLSTAPNEGGYGFEDVSAQAAAVDRPLPLDGDHVGPATIVGYTVVYVANRPAHAVAICDTPGGARTVVRAEEPDLLEAMTREEYCGRVVSVSAGGQFALPR